MLAAYTEAVVVTACAPRASPPAAPHPVSVLASSDLALLPPVPLDDALKSVPGFSLPPHDLARRQSAIDAGSGHARLVGVGRQPGARPATASPE